MMEFIKNSAFFGAMLSLIAYEIGLILKKKFKMAIFNPLLISIICVIGVLVIFHIDYNDYNEGGKYISYLLTPATVCLAVPLYEQIHLLKKNLKAVAAGIISGTLAGLCSILLMARLFGFNHQEYVTMLRNPLQQPLAWEFRGTWRYCDYYSSGYHYHGSSGKHDRGGCL